VSTTAYPEALFGHDPATYVPHALHGEDRVYRETNCWTDVLIELVHARGLEPLAAMGAALRVDFEGDQFSFFKPSPDALERLFGLDIHEMQPYRPVHVQAVEQIAAGRSVIVELDAWFLPDTASTSYRREHVKTSVAIEAIDLDAQRMRYFHNAGFYELEGEDFRGVFRLDPEPSADALPPYTEIARFDAGPAPEGDALRAVARELLGEHLDRRPASNPFERFGARLAADLPDLLAGDDQAYHDYAFATVRMAGSSFELAAAHVDWLFGADGAAATEALNAIVGDCKLLSFKLARRRAFDPEPVVGRMAAAWETATTHLDGLRG
jgi:hypothetical protein